MQCLGNASFSIPKNNGSISVICLLSTVVVYPNDLLHLSFDL